MGEAFGLRGAEAEGFAEGVGDAFSIGLTGPVGFNGGAGVGFAEELGVGEGEGAAIPLESGRQTASAKMKERNFMAEGSQFLRRQP